MVADAVLKRYTGVIGQMAAISRIRVLYSGNVQGVGFRATARSVAKRIPVQGFVKNLPDGSVEMVAEGDAGSLDRLLEGIRKEMTGFIQDETIERGEATKEFRDFTVRF